MAKKTKSSNKSLVIVESPAKARTIAKFLGNSFEIVSSMGHIVDLPKKKMGVDIENGFLPEYQVIPGKNKIILQIKKSAADKKNILIATDPDREGEAIGWHIQQELQKSKASKDKIFQRIVFHEITEEAIKEAAKHPRQIDQKLVDAQQSRRVLDRVVGYSLSPLLWRKIARGLSAGRVQSVALRLIVEREREIQAFKPREYWEIAAELKKLIAEKEQDKIAFVAKLEQRGGKAVEIVNKEQAENFVAQIKNQAFIVSGVEEKQVKRNPAAPFITSTLQQEAFNKLKFNANKTMVIAQQLYEGVDLGEEGPVGLITYMRTDSVNVAESAIKAVRELIWRKFGRDYLTPKPNVYKSKKSAQEAHEAIRPANSGRTPEEVEKFLSLDQFKLYTLIWRRFVASQMTSAKYLSTKISITAGDFLFGVNGSRLLFDGFLKVYSHLDEQKDRNLPELTVGEKLNLFSLASSQHFTKPPSRYSDASLVRLLEENGIGRPSTYAPTIQNIVLRGYVLRQQGYLSPSELGFKVTDLLVEYFPNTMDIKFTAQMEAELDEVEEGKIKWEKVLQDFYPSFKEHLDKAQKEIKKEVVFTKDTCPECQALLVEKWGRSGKFLSCSKYPDCKFSKSITMGIKCPNPGCEGELIRRRSKRGRFFYGCSSYPKCTFIANKLPQEEADDKEKA